MPRWMVICSKCKQEFTHTLVRDLSPGHQTRDVFASPPKPQIPKDGTQLNCPHCGGVQAYKTHDLTYRGD
jgi:DNA-directed RNA polymerase subunit RPC12/RpoP